MRPVGFAALSPPYDLQIALPPARFLVASLAFGDVGFLPLRDRLRLVVAHLVVHAGAVFQHDIRRRIALVVGDALVDPLDVIGGRRDGSVHGERQSGEQREHNGLHESPLRLHGYADVPQLDFSPASLAMWMLSAISFLIIASISAAVIGNGSTPCTASFFRTSGSASALVASACSRSTMARGVFAGTRRPFQKL